MGIWFDLILIAVLIVSVIIGAKKGLFSVVKRFRLLFSVFFAWQLKLTYPVRAIAGKICKVDKEYLRQKIDAEFGQKLQANINNEALSAADKFEDTYGKFGGVLSGAKEYFVSKVNSGASDLVNDITDYVTNAVYDLVFAIIGFCLLVVFFFILFTITYHIINKILDMGVLGILNHMLGALVGAIVGVIWMWLLAILFVKFGPIVFSTDAQTIAGGIGVVRWFVERFFLSLIFGVTL